MLEQVMADSGFPVPLVEGGDCRVFQFHSGTGEGIMTQYDLFPGVSLMYNDFHMESYDSAFHTTEDLLCIDYCRQGRMEYPAGPDAYSYVEAGDLKLDRRLEHQGHFTFPLAHYHGITVGFALPQAAQSLKECFKSIYGQPINTYMRNFRMDQAALLLQQEPQMGVAEIAGRVGYDSSSKFAAAFKEVKGKTPLEYRRESQ